MNCLGFEGRGFKFKVATASDVKVKVRYLLFTISEWQLIGMS